MTAAAPAGAQQAGGMSAMEYYVGTWACTGGPTANAPVKATTTYVMNSDVLSQSVSVPMQPGMKSPLSISLAYVYDGKSRYLQTYLDSRGSWNVSYAPPWTGNTEKWTDLSSNNGKLGRGEAVRTDHDHYTFTGYATPTGSTPNFKITCGRQSS
jgi:hypothetical protein